MGPPGTTVTANTAACPATDPCGVAGAKGCSKCPSGSSWINDGCTCRQPLSLDQFVNGLGTLVGDVIGQQPHVVNFTFLAHVVVENPNFLGASTDAGIIQIAWNGHRIGSCQTRPLNVKARSRQTIPVTVVVDEVSEEVGGQLAADVLSNQGLLLIEASGNLTSTVFGTRVVTTVLCDVISDVNHPERIVDRNCTYSSNGMTF